MTVSRWGARAFSFSQRRLWLALALPRDECAEGGGRACARGTVVVFPHVQSGREGRALMEVNPETGLPARPCAGGAPWGSGALQGRSRAGVGPSVLVHDQPPGT